MKKRASKKSKQEIDLFERKLLEPKEEKRHIYTVSEVTADIKLVIENTFEHVWIEGEVSNFRPSSSGHFYFSLKDEKALLNAVMFNALSSKNVKFKLEDGLKVICFGKIEVYAPYGKYQIIIEQIEPKGVGSLQLAFEQLKTKLEKEGLFEEKYKVPIPYLPKNIGIVTSGTGAAIKDILKVLDRRFKDVHIVVNPVKVQGQGAAEEIVQAIEEFNLYNEKAELEDNIEVMIVGRGGGSIEDLWAFNEEAVARAIFNSKIPVISAVGHERDYTISDWVSDLRAPTPSAAAELVIPRKQDLEDSLNNLKADLKRSFFEIASNFKKVIEDLLQRLKLDIGHVLELDNRRLDNLYKKIAILNPAALIPEYKNRVINLAKEIYVRMVHSVKIKESCFIKAAEKMVDLNPLNILNRGYSVTFKDGHIIREAITLNSGDLIKTRFYKGEVLSKVVEIKKETAGKTLSNNED